MDFKTFKICFFVSNFLLSYLYLNFILIVYIKKKEDKVEKLMQLTVLIGVRIAKIFHFLRKCMGVERIMYLSITFL
jgi:hypothetical protein